MIKIRDANITQILPRWMTDTPEVQALGYAIMKQNNRALDYLERSMVYAGVDNLPEKILDVLAVELRAPYYDNDFDIEKKKKIVKDALYIQSKAGTPEAVSTMIQNVFGGGVMEEWFEYGGEPYHFKIDTQAILDEEINAKFTKLIRKVKNVRSKLDQIIITRDTELKMYVAPVQRMYAVDPPIYFSKQKEE